MPNHITIAEWLQDGNNKVFAFEIEQPLPELLKFHQVVFENLAKQNKEVDPFWLSSKGTPYLLLAISHENGEPTGASYIVGVRDK